MGKLFSTPEIFEVKEKQHMRKSVAFLFSACSHKHAAEEWWVDWLKRHPVLIPYTSSIRTLDKIYLDTSCGWAKNQQFTPKVKIPKIISAHSTG